VPKFVISYRLVCNGRITVNADSFEDAASQVEAMPAIELRDRAYDARDVELTDVHEIGGADQMPPLHPLYLV
jgi:hypothetical protein